MSADEKLDPRPQKLIDMHGIYVVEGTSVEPTRLDVELWYPPMRPADAPTNIAAIEVGLQHVRAADSILISFDFDRNGWSIKQASTFSWEMGDEVCDPDWQEVAFVDAWARDKSSDDE